LDNEERKRLNGHIEALYQKGSLPARKFVEQVIQTIEDNPDNMMLVKCALGAFVPSPQKSD